MEPQSVHFKSSMVNIEDSSEASTLTACEVKIMKLFKENEITLSQAQRIFDSILTVIMQENPITI